MFPNWGRGGGGGSKFFQLNPVFVLNASLKLSVVAASFQLACSAVKGDPYMIYNKTSDREEKSLHMTLYTLLKPQN